MAGSAAMASAGPSGFRALYYDRLDPRVRDWTFVGSPTYPVVACGSYLLFTYIIGPRIVRNRPAFDLLWAIKLHNLIMIIGNAYFCVQILRHTAFAGYNLVCQGITYSTDPSSLRLLELSWYFLLFRTMDFFDTAFFVLRKKFDHVTFQHVSHHFCCLAGGCFWFAIGMDGQPWLGLTINTAIHTVMHTYYLLAACGPRFKPYLWWKPYLTKAQIWQHFVIILHGIVPVFYDCGYPRYLIAIGLPQGLLGLALFLNFHAITYSGRKSFIDVFSANPCHLSDDNDPLKFKRKQEVEFGGDRDKTGCSTTTSSDARPFNGPQDGLRARHSARTETNDAD